MTYTARFILLCALALPAHPLWAETALERLLAFVEDNPHLLSGNIYINLASQSQSPTGSWTVVDSSVGVLHLQTGEDGEAPVPLQIKIDTAAVGATNTGVIRADVGLASDHAPSNPVWIIAGNVATTQSTVSAPAGVISTAPLSNGSAISTSAIGALNTGTININISNRPKD